MNFNKSWILKTKGKLKVHVIHTGINKWESILFISLIFIEMQAVQVQAKQC